MNKPKSNLDFKLISLAYKFRDVFFPRIKILGEAEIKPGSYVLDYGCGPGGYIIPLVKLVGEEGKIYVLDFHPLAIRRAQRIASDNRLKNMETIYSNCKTGLPDNSLDMVLFYDTFHDLDAPNEVLKELYRVLKPNGILSFSDHHMKENEIVSKISNGGLFRLLRKGKRTYSFIKE
jgi:ubiquinone/menaquinone biosynthesis C-methylase UbiE